MDRLNKIISYVSKGRCILFIGAGLSRIAGCYDWDSVVNDMLKHELIMNRLKPENVDNITKGQIISHEEWIEFCERVFTSNGKKNEFLGIVRKAIIKNPEKFQKDYVPLIKRMKQINPFPTIVTTNIDNCLEETLEVSLGRVFYKREDFTTGNLEDHGGSVFHIHGYMEDFENSLITKRKYISRYRQGWFRGFLSRVFSDYSVLFIGYSFRDRDLKDVVLEAQGNNQHFALVPKEDGFAPEDATAFSGLYGIEVIEYGSKNDFKTLFIQWIEKNFKRNLQDKRVNCNG